MFIRSCFLSPDSDAAPAPPAIPPERKLDDLTTQLLAQHGTVKNALRHLIAQSTAHDAELAALRAKLPPEGAVVLTKDAAANWQKLQDLKLSPEQISQAVKERDDLKGSVARGEAEKAARSAAKVAGLDEDAFVAHALGAKLQTEIRDQTVTEHGKSVTKKVAFVRPEGDDKAPYKPISEYTGALPAYEQRALQATAPAPTSGPAFIEQRPTAPTGGGSDYTSDFLAKRNARAAARPNPFLPKPVAPQPVATP